MNTKKTIKQRDPFVGLVLDDYEKELEESLDTSKLKSIPGLKKWKKDLQEAAELTLELRKTKSITFRINQEDLLRLKAKAKVSNLPYQTLLGMLVRDYVKGEYSVKV